MPNPEHAIPPEPPQGPVISGGKFVAALASVAVAFSMLPLVLIWSVNTLFNVGIAYGFDTWAAMASLLVVGVAVASTPSRPSYEP